LARNLQSYWTTTKLWELTVVLDYYEAMETYSRIGLLRSHGNLQSYWTTTKLWKLTVVLDYYEAIETYRRIGLLPSYHSENAVFEALAIEQQLKRKTRGELEVGKKIWKIDPQVTIFHTRFGCIFTSSSLVSSVISHLLRSSF
jgi:hypothetical protein